MHEASVAREITIRRVFAAPRELVWKAWTDPDQLAVWWGKRGWTAVRSTIEMDVRPGGAFSLLSVADDDGREMRSAGVYREVVEPERLVLDDPDGALATVTFTELGDGRTEMVFHATLDTTRQIRDAAEGGLSSAFDRLAEHLA
jgi:uncharacterized protein YndB with AHSA1/START domain